MTTNLITYRGPVYIYFSKINGIHSGLYSKKVSASEQRNLQSLYIKIEELWSNISDN